MKRTVICAAVCAALFALGCGGGDGGSPHSPDNNDSTAKIIGGNWAILASSAVYANQQAMIGGSLTQSGAALTATMHIFATSECYDLETAVHFTGTVSGATIRLTSEPVSGQVITVTGTITSNRTIAGTYTIEGGCAAGDRGSASALAVDPISGTWKAREQSGSQSIVTTAVLTQAATANLDGIFPLTGTVSFTGPTCVKTATLDTSSSFVAGPLAFVTLNIVDVSDQPGILYYLGEMNAPVNPTILDGVYVVDSPACYVTNAPLIFQKQ